MKETTKTNASDILKDPQIQKLVIESTIRRVNLSHLFADPYAPLPKPLTRWQRARGRVTSAIAGTRMRLGSWIAGVSLDEERW